ncbi:hypothetical protein EZJ49_11210 [Bdellovibrio bacteriovorus]|uniref:hypothetical protein n=1 Tax=Bdellovibrio bacteriovorus TaxID=959 RepID=UPI0021CF4A2A|nr:hypothetical protein [Bdellovibrio bacteriovorus]UXR63642.1 hypothetical protein EZJ49_11210 [Bdellovibrio bacteriovorus]
MKTLWGIAFGLLISSSAYAALFSQLQGTYQVLGCENLGATPYNSVCQFAQLTIRAEVFFTAITFTGDPSQDHNTLTLTLPASLEDQPAARYREKSDTFAIYSNEGRHGGQVVMLRRLKNGLYHLSVHLRSDVTKTLDVIEVDLEKLY